jgi:hypothetical protein
VCAGAQRARTHFTENDPIRKHSEMRGILVAEGPHTLGTVEAWVQPSELLADRSAAVGEVTVAYLWQSSFQAMEAFAINLRQMSSESEEGEILVGPKLKKDKLLLLNHLVLALKESNHPFTPQAFTCLARSIQDPDLMQSGEGCRHLIQGNLKALAPQLNHSVVPLVSKYFNEQSTFTAHSLGILDVLIWMCESVQPTMVVLVGSGLSNRMRTVVPALIFARQSGRKLLIIWPLDPHCRARMSDLYDVSQLGENVQVLDVELTAPPEMVDSLFNDQDRNTIKTYVYSNWVTPTINLEGDHHIYVRSVYWLKSSHGDSRPELGNLDAEVTAQLLSLVPSQVVAHEVKEEMSRIQHVLDHTRGDRSDVLLVTVHVRMQANMSLDVPSPLQHMVTEMELLGEIAKTARTSCGPASMLVSMRQVASVYRSQGKQVFCV